MKFLRNIFYQLTPRQRRLARWLWFLPVDIFTKKQALVPPKRLVNTGAGDFAAIGDKMVAKIIKECSVGAGDKILDIGCGIGRIARPFTKYINSNGAYHGFDVVATGIAWCKRHYKEFENFNFQYVAVNNDLYNANASQQDWNFIFPYNDDFFDVAVSISVFTHMQSKGFQNYLHEMARVLKRGKYCFATFFVMNEERKINFNNSTSFFKYRENDCYLHDKRIKNANVAYDYATIEKMAFAEGLQIIKFIPGWWNDGINSDKFDFQDVLIFIRK